MKRILVRSSVWRPRISRLPVRQLRRQHEAGGHKWYFQDPPAKFQTDASLLRRFFKSSLYAAVFCAIGAAATNGFTTWTWLNTAFIPGEEADTMYMQLIEERMAAEPLTKLLEEEGSEWVRLTTLEEDGLDRCLKGSRGVHMRHYCNPSKGNIMMVMIHFGEGCEGLPGIVHGGALTSFLHNSMEVFGQRFFPVPKDFDSNDDGAFRKLVDEGYWRTSDFEISFDRPVSSGDVYAIIVVPALLLGTQMLEGLQTKLPHMPKVKFDKENFPKTVVASLMQVDHIPLNEPTSDRLIRYAIGVGVFGKVQLPPAVKPFELSMDGKIS